VRLIGEVLLILLDVALCLLIARAVISWINILLPRWRQPWIIQRLFRIIHTITEPPLAWLRRYIRPIGAGGISLDLSFMVWFVVLLLVQRIVVVVFF